MKYSDFVASTIDIRKQVTDKDLLSVFTHFDTAGQGRITSTDLVNAFSRTGQQVSKEEVRKMMEEVAQGKQYIDFE